MKATALRVTEEAICKTRSMDAGQLVRNDTPTRRCRTALHSPHAWKRSTAMSTDTGMRHVDASGINTFALKQTHGAEQTDPEGPGDS